MPFEETNGIVPIYKRQQKLASLQQGNILLLEELLKIFEFL